MAEKVSFKITTSDKMPGLSNGQIIFVEDTGGIYVDFHGERRQYGKTSSGINYVGISTTDPMTGKVTIDGEIWTPAVNDMVVYNSKEYLWRKGQDGTLRWFEMGDEESPVWDDD